MIVAMTVRRPGEGLRYGPCVKVEVRQSFGGAVFEVKRQLGNIQGKCRVVFGAELFSFRNLSLPFTDKKKIEQVLPMELAEQIPVEIDTLLFAYVVTKTGPKGVELLVATIERTVLAEYVALLRSAGFEPEFIGISGYHLAQELITRGQGNCLLLDIDSNWTTLFLLCNGRVASIRSLAGIGADDNQTASDDRLALFVKQTLLGGCFGKMQEAGSIAYCNASSQRIPALPDFTVKRYGDEVSLVRGGQLLHDSHCRPENLLRLLTCGQALSTRSGGFDFLKDEFRREKTISDYRRQMVLFAVPTLLCCLFAALYFAYDYKMLTAKQEGLRQQITEVFNATVPAVTKIVQPVQQLQVFINDAKNTYKPDGMISTGYSVIDLLSELSVRIPPVASLKVVRLVADGDVVLLKAVTGDFNTVDTVQRELAKSSFFREVIISSANQGPQGHEVSFELKLVLVGR